MVASLSYTILDSTPSSNIDPANDIYLQSTSSPAVYGMPEDQYFYKLMKKGFNGLRVTESYN
ncbi:MAG: hypothetical protein ACXVHY_07025 [Methanobacterium sp.]